MQNEPTDSSAQHFPANNFLPLCRETRKTASFQQAAAVISFQSPNELSLVFHFAPFPSPFVTASFSYYCSQKCLWHLIFFFSFLAHDLVHSVPSISLWLTHTPIVQEQWYFPFGLLDKCWYSWLVLTKARHSILMDFKSDSVYVSIIPTVDTHGWIPPHWEGNTVLCQNYTSGSLGACHLLGTVPWVIG